MASLAWSDGGLGVGQVSMLIGKASVVRADGTRQDLHLGARIHVGDRIETAPNGHVLMQFVDKGAMSVRPDSVLEVQAYAFDADRPQDNQIRLRLERGVSRSISGAATDTDKSRFRLNTPIAAIGVRGTDFTVQTGSEGVRATVNDGAIVVSALGAGCSSAGLGPCSGTEVRELTADMGRLMAEVVPGDPTTRIVPAADLSPAGVASAAMREAAIHDASLSAARASGVSAAEPSPKELQRGNDRATAGLLTLATVNMPDLNRPANPSAQLLWGRWAILPDPHDKLSVPFALAVLGRHVTVADHSMGLFRANTALADGGHTPGGPSGIVEFRLSRASATYERGTGIESALVQAGNLTVDFARRTFATALDVSSTSGVRGELRAAGDMRSDGIFTVRDPEQRVAGAVSLDGKEAGYLFERSAAGGLFRGRTLWGD
jgi:hypothetical protein